MCCGWGEREFIWNIDECSCKSPRKMSSHANRGQADFRFVVFYGLLVSLCVLVSEAEAAPASVAAVGSAAEIQKNFKLTASGLEFGHLHRLKRDAEISFGNSQNEPRDKKSLSDNEVTAAANPATVPAVAAAANQIPAQQPFVVSAGSAANSPETAAAAAEANRVDNKARDDDDDNDDGNDMAKQHKNENRNESKTSNEQLVGGEDNHVIEPDNVVGGEEEPKLRDSQLIDGEESDSYLIGGEDEHLTEQKDDSGDVAHENDDNNDDNDSGVIHDDNADDDGDATTEEAGHQKETDDDTDRKQEHADPSDDQHSNDDEGAAAAEGDTSHTSGITKRSAPAMTAESMGSSIINADVHRRASSRTKRDLGYDELREMINAGQVYPARLPYNEEGEGYPLPSYTNLDEDQADYEPGDDNWLSPGLESNVDDSFLLPTHKEEALEKEIVRYEVLQRLLKEKEEEQAKEAVLEYLIAAAEDRLNEAVEEEKEAELEEKLVKIAANSNSPLFESANQYKVNKRYPYSYEPYGGPWGAMVPGVKRSGSDWYEPERTGYNWNEPVDDADNYDRLYRLAEALGDNK